MIVTTNDIENLNI